MRSYARRTVALLPIVVLFSVSFAALTASTSVAASQHEYIALGDSIAAGQDHESTSQ